MKKSERKLTFNKESVRVLSKPELTAAAGGFITTVQTTAITCTEWPSICMPCTTHLSCGGGCESYDVCTNE